MLLAARLHRRELQPGQTMAHAAAVDAGVAVRHHAVVVSYPARTTGDLAYLFRLMQSGGWESCGDLVGSGMKGAQDCQLRTV